MFNDPTTLIASIIGLLIAITIHEFSHAFVADYLGDPTPRSQGRVSLNPLAHLDPVGTLFLIIAGFGWGKPVQYDPYNLRNPKRDASLISLAGPASNILLAIIISFILRLISIQIPEYLFILFLLRSIVIINVTLAIFNLIPVYPLDGFRVVGGLLSGQKAQEWENLSKYGFIFLLMMLLPLSGTSIVFRIIGPIINSIIKILL